MTELTPRQLLNALNRAVEKSAREHARPVAKKNAKTTKPKTKRAAKTTRKYRAAAE